MNLRDRLYSSPFLRAVAKKGDGNPVQSAADVIGEREMYALALISGAIAVPDQDFSTPEWREATANLWLTAVPVLWLNELANAGRQMVLPKHTVGRHVMPHPSMWWTFEGDQPFWSGEPGQVPPDTSRLQDSLLAVHLREWEDGVVINSVVKGADGQYELRATGFIRYGQVYPKGEYTAENLYLAMLAFMASPALTERRKLGTPRAERRRLPVEPPPVEFVTLRRSPSVQSDGAGTHHGYTVRWIVSGHFRAQWYPGEQAHRLIWIAPYVKGPDSAPLKLPAYKVAR